MKKIFCFLTVIMLLASTPSFATLGESSASVHADRVLLKGVTQETTSNRFYNVEMYQVAPKIKVREYISKSGTVFAVSWSGPLKPDLRQLLGKYYAVLTAQFAKKSFRGRSPLYIKNPNVVIESYGHPRSFFGRAYLPAAIPSGMMDNEIKPEGT